MNIRDISELDEIDLQSLEFIGSGHYGNVYRISEKRVLKVYHDALLALSLEKNHAESFLEYLSKLSEKKSKILVTPEDVFKDEHGYVFAYISEYTDGIKLTSDFGETDINVFMEALNTFYCELSKINDLVLYDASARNLIFGKDLKLVDLDLARFERYLDYEDILKENYRILNSSIFKAIIKKDPNICLRDVNLFELVCLIELGSYPLPSLLKEYVDYINKHYIEVEKVKDLRYPYVGRL